LPSWLEQLLLLHQGHPCVLLPLPVCGVLVLLQLLLQPSFGCLKHATQQALLLLLLPCFALQLSAGQHWPAAV
jgi:hypothetical protein